MCPLAEDTVLRGDNHWARFLLQASFDPKFRDLVRKSFTASSFQAVHSALVSRLDHYPDGARGVAGGCQGAVDPGARGPAAGASR